MSNEIYICDGPYVDSRWEKVDEPPKFHIDNIPIIPVTKRVKGYKSHYITRDKFDNVYEIYSPKTGTHEWYAIGLGEADRPYYHKSDAADRIARRGKKDGREKTPRRESVGLFDQPDQNEKLEALRGMKIHETRYFKCEPLHFWVVRVPGGWIYTQALPSGYSAGEPSRPTRAAGVAMFVPDGAEAVKTFAPLLNHEKN